MEDKQGTDEMANPELVAKLEAERLKGMPRWRPRTAAEEEQRRRLAAQTWEQDAALKDLS